MARLAEVLDRAGVEHALGGEATCAGTGAADRTRLARDRPARLADRPAQARRPPFVGRYVRARRRSGASPGRTEGVGGHDDLARRRAWRLEPIAEVDPVLWEAMLGERRRQHDKIELIASENYTSAAVMEAQGSWLTNKYAEGLPGKRYYGGCEYVDVAERLAQERALALFPGAEHVNVQPHSGAQANMAAYFSVLEPGDRIMGMNLAHGGHLTHGMALNFSRPAVRGPRLRRPRGHRADRLRRDGQPRRARSGPKLIVGGASAYPRIWDFERMAEIAADVGALLFVDMAHIAGLVAAGVHPSPFPHADIVTTTTHKTLRGRAAGWSSAARRCRTGVDPTAFPAVKTAADGALAASIDKTVFPGVQGGPLMHVIAGKAVAFKLAAEEPFRATSGGRSRTRRPGRDPRRARARGSSRAAPTTT